MPEAKINSHPPRPSRVQVAIIIAFCFFFNFGFLLFAPVIKVSAATFSSSFSDNFNSLTNGTIVGQNGWVAGGQGVWSIGAGGTDSGKILSQTSASTTNGFNLNYVSNGSSTWTDEQITADFYVNSTTVSVPQFWLRKTAASGDAGGYLLFTNGIGALWCIGAHTANSSSSFLPFVTVPATISTNTWYTAMAQVVNNASGTPVLSLYIYPQGGVVPGTPTLTYTDNAKTFQSGYIGFGANRQIVSYDNVTVNYNLAATTYSLTGSSTAIVGVGDVFTVTPNGTYSGTITPTSTAGGTFAPTSLTFSSSSVAQTFTYTPSVAGTTTIGATSNPVLTNPSSTTVTTSVASATTYTLTGSSNAIAGVGDVFTVTPNSTYSGTITPTSAAGGTFSPTSLTFSNSSVAQTFTYTPSAAGTTIISATSNPALTNPSSTTVTTVAYSFISPSNPNIYFSPYNWAPFGATEKEGIAGGSYVKVAFTGTSLGVQLDLSNSASVLGSNLLTAYINGATTPVQRLLSAADGNSIVSFATGLTPGNHYAVIYFSFQLQNTERWNVDGTTTSANVFRVKNIILDQGATTTSLLSTPIVPTTGKLLMFGDSLTEGIGIGSTTTPQSERGYAPNMARTVGLDYGQVGYGCQGWIANCSQLEPTWDVATNTEQYGSNSWWSYNNASSRVISTSTLSNGFKEGSPAAVTMNLGFNDSNQGYVVPTSTFSGYFTKMRQVSGTSTEVFMIVPFAMTGNPSYSAVAGFVNNYANMKAGYAQYVANNPTDYRAHLIDLGAWGGGVEFATGGIHPNASGSSYLGTALGDIMRPYFYGSMALSTTSVVLGQNVTIAATGTSTLWAGNGIVTGYGSNPTLGSSTFKLINNTSGASIVTQTVVNNTAANITINTGNAAGTFTLYDPSSDQAVQLQVAAPSSYYVDPATGSNANQGISSSTPLATLQQLVMTPAEVVPQAGTVTSTSNITFVYPVQISIGSSTVSLPAGTAFTTVASTTDFTQLVATTTVDASNLPSNYTLRGDLAFGLPSSSINLSQPVLITIPVDISLNGTTPTVFRKEPGDTSWTNIGSCAVSNSSCMFTTSNLSSFVVASYSAPSTTSTTGTDVFGPAVAVAAGYGLPYISGAGIIASSTTVAPLSTTTTTSASQLQALIQSLTQQLYALQAQANGGAITSPSAAYARNLSLGMTGSDVMLLQQYLINQSAGLAVKKLADHGATQFFGLLTKAALIEFQKSVHITPASGRFGSVTRAYVISHEVFVTNSSGSIY